MTDDKAAITTALQQDVLDALAAAFAELEGGSAPTLGRAHMRQVAISMAGKLSRSVGGRYVPYTEDRAVRDAQVVAAYVGGASRQEVMRKFCISRALFYNILARNRALLRKV